MPVATACSKPRSERAHTYAALSGLYFTQGVPYGFFTQALPVILRQEGASLTQVGLSSLLALPWGLKFIWAPLVDRYRLSRLERRLSWIVPLNLLSAAILLAMAVHPAWSTDLVALQLAFFILNFAAATQDIASDSLAVTMFSSRDRGLANGVQVAAYRVGMLVAGGVLLSLHATLGLSGIFAAMAALELLALVPLLLLPQRLFDHANPQTTESVTNAACFDPPFLTRPDAARLVVLLFVFKFGEHFSSSMIRPFLTDRGAGLAGIGEMLGTYGFAGGLAGALIGGALVHRLGRRNALIAFGLAQSLGLATYAGLAFVTVDLRFATLACLVEHLTSGMATAALFTCMMDWSSRAKSGFDYTLQASIVVAATAAAATLGGMHAQVVGYALHFTLGIGLSVVGVLVAAWLYPRA